MEALSLLIKPASGSCNLRCKYCFYADVTSSREMEDHGMMSEDTLETIVKKALSEATQFVSFGFQGGEPMLSGKDFFRDLIKFQKKYNKGNVEIYNSIQTNGTLIDKEWARFFADNKFLVGLSIDGPEEIHNAMRVNTKDEGTHALCLEGARKLTDAGADFNILSVVTEAFAKNPDQVYQFYKDNNFHFIQLIPCLDGLNEPHGVNAYSLPDKLYGEFLSRFFDLWYEDFIRGDYYSIRSFDNYVRMLMGQLPENCGMMGTCSSYPVIEADGDVYPCDFYVLDEHKLGNIKEKSFSELLTSKASKEFMEPSRNVPDGCKECSYYFICRNGCRRDRVITPDNTIGLNYYCEGYKIFFEHALPPMKEIAQKMPR